MARVTHPLSAGTLAEIERRRLRTLRERLARLEDIRGGGVSKVTYADRSVEFRSDAELAREIDFLKREINPSTTRNLLVRASKGW